MVCFEFSFYVLTISAPKSVRQKSFTMFQDVCFFKTIIIILSSSLCKLEGFMNGVQSGLYMVERVVEGDNS